MPTGHDPTRLYRAPVSPRCSVKLGPQAAWSKVKYSAQSTRPRTLRSSHIVKFGSNGEVLVAYNNTLEVWDWLPSSLQMLSMANDTNGHHNESSQRALYLVASLNGIQGTIEDIEPLEMDQNSNTYRVLLALRVKSEVHFSLRRFGQLFRYYSEFEEDTIDKPLILPPFVHGSGPFSVKGSSAFVGIATNEGSLTVFDQAKGHPISLSFEVSVVNGKPAFDIAGRYLAYISSDPESASPLTKMDVPSHNHSIYSNILQNMSLSAIDGITKLSDISSLKHALNDRNLTSNVKTYISNLINGLKQSQRVMIIDLPTQKTLASFKPPCGVSNLSLSPFNTHMVTISQRGDQIYKWDITRAPLEVSLLDIQVRGKTGSVVDEIHWASNDIFQIVTRASGSIHCFQPDVSQNWVLPNIQASRLCTVNDELLALVRDELFVIDSKGNCNAKYTLPTNAIAASLLPDYIHLEPVEEIVERTKADIKKTPLAEVEIETCFMGQPFYASEKMELGTYNDSTSLIWDKSLVFGDELNITRVEFSKGNGQPVFCGEKDDLESAMTSVLVFDEGL